MTARPTVRLDCVAQGYAAPNERIVEISSTHGGCLIAVIDTSEGLMIDVYRSDPDHEKVRVRIGENIRVSGGERI